MGGGEEELVFLQIGNSYHDVAKDAFLSIHG